MEVLMIYCVSVTNIEKTNTRLKLLGKKKVTFFRKISAPNLTWLWKTGKKKRLYSPILMFSLSRFFLNQNIKNCSHFIKDLAHHIYINFCTLSPFCCERVKGRKLCLWRFYVYLMKQKTFRGIKLGFSTCQK